MSDRLVVTAFMGVAANAVYAVANKIPHLLTLAQTTFAMAWQESASIASGDEDAGSYYTRMFSVMLGFYAGCLGLLIAVTPVLFPIVIKGDYGEAYGQMPLLFPSVFFSSMSSFLGGIYIALKATRSVGVTTSVAAAANVVVDVALIGRIGIYAASLSTLVSYACLFAYRTVDLRRLIEVRYDWRKLGASLAILAVETALFYLGTAAGNAAKTLVAASGAWYLLGPIAAGIKGKARGMRGPSADDDAKDGR